MGNSKNLAFWLVLMVLMIALYNIFSSGMAPSTGQEVNYSEFLTQVETGKVSNVQIDGENVVFQTGSGTFTTVQPSGTNDYLVPLLQENEVNFKAEAQEQSTLSAIIISFLPFILLIGVWIYFMNKMQGGGKGGAMGFGKSRAKMLTESSGKVTFSDVAGIDEAKEELEEISVIRNYRITVTNSDDRILNLLKFKKIYHFLINSS